MKFIFRILTFLFLTLFFQSCYTVSDDSTAGPCVHTYMEPILHIISVTDSASNQPVNYIILKNLKINGIKKAQQFYGEKAYGIVFADSVYICNFPCGFGIEKGNYEFTIAAPGYKEKNISISNVDYSIYKGGCPSYNDGGKRISVVISK